MASVEELFGRAYEIDAGRRGEWLREQCGQDDGLYDQVVSLLRSAGLERQLQEARTRARPKTRDSQDGMSIGPYLVTRTLGSGGMGTVYLAHRQAGDVDQTAAVKVLSAAAAHSQFLRYFLEERQILARLVHPNIARFLDAGSLPDGAPYLVMEYIDGQPLHEYQDSRRIDLRQRLDLFRKICGAVSFLHQNLILHRDLKPSNILVTADGEPKLLDFGAAKLLEQADLTQTGMAPLTPRYASPEQMHSKPVTTQSDVFALGVILYESLTGAWPFGDPASPGALLQRFSKSAQPGGLNPTAARDAITENSARERASTASALRRDLTGDLGRIVNKALADEPTERYDSAAALSEDVRRYLDHEPVLARPQTWRYRLSKFVLRNRAAVAAATLFTLALAAASGMAIWQARAARQASARAERRFQDVRKLTRLVLFDFHDQLAKVPGGMALQQSMIAQTLDRFESLARESNGDPEILAELGEGYVRLGDIQGNPYSNNKGDATGAVAIYQRGLALLGRSASGSPSLDLAVGRLMRSKSRTLRAQGKTGEALDGLRQAVTAIERSVRAAPSAEAELQLMQTNSTIGDILLDQDPKQALTMYEEAGRVLERIVQRDPSQRQGGTLFYKRGACQELLGNLPAAIDLYRQGLAAHDRLPEKSRGTTDSQRSRASLLSVLGSGLAEQGRGEEALPYLAESVAISKALSAADPGNSRALYSLAANLNNRNMAYRSLRLEDKLFAGRLEEEAVWNALLGHSPIFLYQSAAAMNLDALSQTFGARGQGGQARQYMRRALDLLAVVVASSPNPEDRRRYAETLLAGGAAELRDPKLALEQMQLAMRDSPNPTKPVLLTYGLALLRNGLGTQAIKPLERSLAMMAREGGGAGETVDAALANQYLQEARRAR